MARRSREDIYPETKTFHYYNANPKNRITGDCTFRAICTALEQSWEQTVMEMAELSCQTGYAINDTKGIERYLASKGWTKHRQPRKEDNTKYTGSEFCKKIAKKNVRYVANIGGNHIVAIIDKKVNDIWDSTYKCIGNYWTKE